MQEAQIARIRNYFKGIWVLAIRECDADPEFWPHIKFVQDRYAELTGGHDVRKSGSADPVCSKNAMSSLWRSMRKPTKRGNCPRCSGTGRNGPSHIKGGLCFRCEGTGNAK